MNSETSAAGLLRELDLEDQAEGREPATGWKKNPRPKSDNTARFPSQPECLRRRGVADWRAQQSWAWATGLRGFGI